MDRGGRCPVLFGESINVLHQGTQGNLSAPKRSVGILSTTGNSMKVENLSHCIESFQMF